MLNNKKGIGLFIAEMFAVFFTIMLLVFFNILFRLTVSERVYKIGSDYHMNDLKIQVLSYLKTPYDSNNDVFDNILIECDKSNNFENLKTFTNKLNLPRKLNLEVECNNNLNVLKGKGCDNKEFLDVISLNENKYIKINYC